MTRRKLMVMVVDDAPGRAALVQGALRRAGYEVVPHAASTIELHERVMALKPDVVIIATDSPDRDTLENLSVISRDAPRPVILFTQDGDGEKIRAAMSAGVSAYVVDGLSTDRVKPVIDVAVARFEQFQAMRDEIAASGEKLAERKIIDRAKGILMKSRGLSEPDAYAALRTQAMQTNTRIADVARQVVSLAGLLSG